MSISEEDSNSPNDDSNSGSDVDSNINTGNSQDGIKNLQATQNEDNILMDGSSIVVDVNNTAELASLFTGVNALSKNYNNVVINLVGDDNYVLTGGNTISRDRTNYNYWKMTNLTINGNNKIIDGNGLYNFIYFDFDNDFGLITVTLNNMTFRNCKYGNGGVIYSWGGNVNLTINGCIFANNTATTECGAIRFAGGTLNINDCVFTNNSATGYAFSDGGAVFSGSPVTVVNTRFEDNRASSQGGALNVNAELVVIDSSFINNSLYQTSSYTPFGGAIFHASDSTLTIIGSNFTGNSVTNTKKKKAAGGAVYSQGTINITNCKFTENTAFSTQNSFGGALFSERTTCTITSSDFISNDAYRGGAVYVPYTLVVDKCNFISNNATEGGALYGAVKGPNEPIFYQLTIRNSNFTSNRANTGGAIFTCTDSTISGNNIINNSAGNGGAIYLHNLNSVENTREVSILANTFKDNLATSASGWVVYLNNLTTIENNVFVNNTDNKRDMLFNVLGKSVKGNVYIDNYLNDTWDNIDEPVRIMVGGEKELHIVNLRNVYNDNIVNGTILCYLGNSEESFASFEVHDGVAKLVFDDSKLSFGLNNIKIKYVSLSKHYQTLEKNLQVFLMETSINITVRKVWDDGNNPNRPKNVTIILMNDSGVVSTGVLKESNGWIYIFENLPRFDANDVEINYSIIESNIPDGYIATVTNTSYNNFTVKNTQTVTVDVTKIWDDYNNREGIRPNNVTVNLIVNGLVNQTVVLNGENNWKYSFIVPKYNNGVLIKYNFTEDTINNYTAFISNVGYSYTVTNIHIIDFVNVTVSSIFDDANNKDGLRPDNVTVKLIANGGVIAYAVLDPTNNWNMVFSNLPKYDENKVLINYSIIESAVPNGYMAIVTNTSNNNFTVKNIQTVAVDVTKIWDDYNNQEGLRPNDVIVHLTVDGFVNQTVVLNSGNNWKYSFIMPKYNNGVLINYNFTEDAIDNYIAVISNVGYSYTVTNIHSIETVNLTVSSIFDDYDNRDGLRPNSVTVRLIADGAIIDSAVLNAANNWNISFNNLPKFKNNDLIDYTFTVNIPEYISAVSSSDNNYIVTNTHVPETLDLKVLIKWNDTNDNDKVRPEYVKIQLYANGVEVGEPVLVYSKSGSDENDEELYTKVLSAINHYVLGEELTNAQDQYVFRNVFKYENGQVIDYSISEEVSNQYNQTITLDGNVFRVTNSHKLAEVDHKVIISWSGDADQLGTVKVQLYANGVAQGKPIKLSTDSTQKFIFENLHKYTNGELTIYTVKLVDLPKGYSEEVSQDGKYVVKIKVNHNKTGGIKWSWKLVRVKLNSKDSKNTNGTTNPNDKGYSGKSKNLNTLSSQKSLNYLKAYNSYKASLNSYKSSYNNYHRSHNSYNSYNDYNYNNYNNDYDDGDYVYRLYINLYSQYMNGTLSYKDFVAILRANNLVIKNANWKNGKMVLEFDDLDEVPDSITIHSNKGNIPDSSSNVDKTKNPDKDNVIDSGEVDTSNLDNSNTESSSGESSQSSEVASNTQSSDVESNMDQNSD